MTETERLPQLRKRPRPSETISIGGKTKWRLDALCLAGRRSRTATIDILMEFYFKHNKPVADFVAERCNDPKPIQIKRTNKENPPDAAFAAPEGERNLTP